jgi:branched-chain amino acid transport system substrate-binding protein
MRHPYSRYLALSAGGLGVALATALSGLGSAMAAPCGGDQPLAIGVFGPLTGPSKDFGEMALNSVKLALADFEKTGGCSVEIKLYDSQGAAAQAPALAQRALRDASVIAVIGPQFSGEAKAAMPILNAGGLPAVTAVATNPGLTQQGWTFFHRTSGNDANEGPADARYIIDQMKAAKAAVIDNSGEYGQGIADYVRQTLADGHVDVSVSESIDAAAPDYSATINKIKASGAEAVYCGCYYTEASRLLIQMRQSGVTVRMIGASGLYDHRFMATVGGVNAEGTVTSTQALAPGHFEGSADFEARYKALNQSEPLPYAPETYDAATAIMKGIAAGAVTRSALNDWLSNKADFQGVSGRIKFDKNGNVSGSETSFFVAKNGVFEFQTALRNGKWL